MSKNNNKKIAIGAGILLGLGTLGFFGYHTAKQTHLLKNQNELTVEQTQQDSVQTDTLNTHLSSIDSTLQSVTDSNAVRSYQIPSIYTIINDSVATITDHNGYVRDSITDTAQIKTVKEQGSLDNYMVDFQDTASVKESATQGTPSKKWSSHQSSNKSSTSSNIPSSATGDYTYSTSDCAGCLEHEINGSTYYVDTTSIEGKREAYALGLLNTEYGTTSPWNTVGSFTPTPSELEMGAQMKTKTNQDN
ncbi:MAG: hypothetical protein ACLFNM_00850 [Candidatus Woesearchaeota archaeon]